MDENIESKLGLWRAITPHFFESKQNSFGYDD
jgi:hypothetical protein